MTEKIAFFDFDDTLCRGDSILPYLLYSVRRGIAPWRQVFHALWGYLRWRVNPASATNAKNLTLSYIAGHTQAELDALGRDFFKEQLLPRFFPQGLQELARLKAEGFRIIVVTASADVYMRLLPEFMPVDHVIATRCALDAAGRYTGVVEENCKGEEKPRRIRAWLEAQGMTPDWPACRAYGDSLSDAPMLALTGHPVLVDPKKALLSRLPDAKRVHWH